MNVVPIKPTSKVSAEMSAETLTLVRRFVALNANNARSTHGPMTIERLAEMLLDDVAAAVRDGGNTWQGCHMALVLREHGYEV
jgi:hypothetical protein